MNKHEHDRGRYRRYRAGMTCVDVVRPKARTCRTNSARERVSFAATDSGHEAIDQDGDIDEPGC